MRIHNEDLIGLLDALATQVEAGSGPVASSHLAIIDQAIERIGDGRSVIGSAAERVASARGYATSQTRGRPAELSGTEDVARGEEPLEEQLLQHGYEATLRALAKALPPSLASFLR